MLKQHRSKTNPTFMVKNSKKIEEKFDGLKRRQGIAGECQLGERKVENMETPRWGTSCPKQACAPRARLAERQPSPAGL